MIAGGGGRGGSPCTAARARRRPQTLSPFRVPSPFIPGCAMYTNKAKKVTESYSSVIGSV